MRRALRFAPGVLREGRRREQDSEALPGGASRRAPPHSLALPLRRPLHPLRPVRYASGIFDFASRASAPSAVSALLQLRYSFVRGSFDATGARRRFGPVRPIRGRSAGGCCAKDGAGSKIEDIPGGAACAAPRSPSSQAQARQAEGAGPGWGFVSRAMWRARDRAEGYWMSSGHGGGLTGKRSLATPCPYVRLHRRAPRFGAGPPSGGDLPKQSHLLVPGTEWRAWHEQRARRRNYGQEIIRHAVLLHLPASVRGQVDRSAFSSLLRIIVLEETRIGRGSSTSLRLALRS